ncbi:MAG TPA: hypothetical protein VK463_21390 [Desulfomonilaceae bacterium]|nr:hypothetical protein [Desulfomonilaceae bacterium]
MKLSSRITRTILFVIALAMVLLCAAPSGAQSLSWWGSGQWFDWSDFRAAVGARYYFARLTSGSLSMQTPGLPSTVDLLSPEIGLPQDPDPFQECWGILYIDRLGLRFNIEIHDFPGRPTPRRDGSGLTGRWELQSDSSRVGIDLDLIRFPFLRFGVDYDYTFNDVQFIRLDVHPNYSDGIKAVYESLGPMTVGIHGRVIPGRIRDIPVTAQARFRFPVPFVKRKGEAQVTDWEVSAGLRPAIWETSVFSSTTFSFGIEAGYRAIDLSLTGQKDNLAPENGVPNLGIGLVPLPPQMQLNAHWQGAFVQAEFFF